MFIQYENGRMQNLNWVGEGRGREGKGGEGRGLEAVSWPHKKKRYIDQCANISKLKVLYIRSRQVCYIRFCEL